MDDERETEIKLTLRIAAEATEEDINEIKRDVREHVLEPWEHGGFETDEILHPNGVIVYYEWE
jgi:hypothetical protein